MKKTELKVTKYDGLSPVAGICSSCTNVTFEVMFPERHRKPEETLSELQGDFYRHFKKVHMREDASQAAARVVREATEEK